MDIKVEAVKKKIGIYDVEKIRKDFPILSQKVHGKNLCYLDVIVELSIIASQVFFIKALIE